MTHDGLFQSLYADDDFDDVVVCPNCRQFRSFWDGVGDHPTDKVITHWTCPVCTTKFALDDPALDAAKKATRERLREKKPREGFAYFLEPCPSCGNTDPDEFEGGDDSPTWLTCSRCKFDGPEVPNEPLAYAAWNLFATDAEFARWASTAKDCTKAVRDALRKALLRKMSPLAAEKKDAKKRGRRG